VQVNGGAVLVCDVLHGVVDGRKVETPIQDSIRELVTWECKEHGVNIMNVLANPKESVGRWNLNFWRLEQFYTNF